MSRRLAAISPDDIQQNVDVDWLDDRRDGAERPGELFDVDRPGHDRNRHVRDGGVAQLRTPELGAAEARHHQIQQHQTGCLRLAALDSTQKVQRLESILRRHGLETSLQEQRGYEVARLRVVFDDEDVTGRGFHRTSMHFKSRARSGSPKPARIGPGNGTVSRFPARPDAPDRVSYAGARRDEGRVERISRITEMTLAMTASTMSPPTMSLKTSD